TPRNKSMESTRGTAAGTAGAFPPLTIADTSAVLNQMVMGSYSRAMHALLILNPLPWFSRIAGETTSPCASAPSECLHSGVSCYLISVVQRSIFMIPVISRPSHSALDPKSLFLFQSQIAQFDCSVCTGEEADEARTDRDDPRRIDTGYNPDVDEPSLQHSTADCARKPKNDPKNKDERRLHGFFHCRSQKVGSKVHPRPRSRLPAA